MQSKRTASETGQGQSDQEQAGSQDAASPARAYCPVEQEWVAVHDTAPQNSELSLRAWRLSDAPVLRRLLDDPEMWRFLPERFHGVMSDADARDLIRLKHATAHHIVQAISSGDEIVGQVRLEFEPGRPQRIGELSYWIGKRYWGKGLASTILPRFTSALFTDLPHLLQIEARVHPDNTASAHVLRKSGFAYQEKREDADGRHVYARRR
ncbi:GNAT family N-acetyltransferase [Primorskyibacter sp. S187A]|uniref:GNAT family N-acetyltransferase n=1 Tax=Primorskyibacter sp. S187A TaxID=3415130 RepID=UPI003C7D2880